VYADKRISGDPMVVRQGKGAEIAADHLGPANLRKQECNTTIAAIFGPLWTGDRKPDDALFAEAHKTFQAFLDKKAE